MVRGGDIRYAVTDLFTETNNNVTAIKLSYKDRENTVNKIVLNSDIQTEPIGWSYQQTEIDYGTSPNNTTKNLILNIVNFPGAEVTLQSKIIFLSNTHINNFSDLTNYLSTRFDSNNQQNPTISCCGGRIYYWK